MTEHKLKIWPNQYQSILNGIKMFEYRKNDRDYQTGDTLILNEWSPKVNKYTGRKIRVRVTYIFNKTIAGDIPIEIAPGFCVMSIKPIFNHHDI